MLKIEQIRRLELYFAAGLTLIYVVRQLYKESEILHDMLKYASTTSHVDPPNILNELVSYNYAFNSVLPFLSGAFFTVSACCIFHFIVFPKIKEKQFGDAFWILSALSILLVFSGIFLFYYFKRNLRFTHDSLLHIDGLIGDPVYSKKNIFSDVMAVFVLAGVYEMFIQIYYNLHNKLKETETNFRYISYSLPLLLLVFFIYIAVIANLPGPLWNRSLDFRDWLMIAAFLLVFVFLLQAFVYKYIIPSNTRTPGIIGSLIIYLFICFAGDLVLCIVYNQYYFINEQSFLFLFLFTLFASGSIAFLRVIFSSEKRKLETKFSNKSAELAGLRAQINPHFLFNALNSLYAAALKEGSEKTADGIQKLGDMMRFMLHENNHERILLQKEVEYLRNYIEIQRLRIDSSGEIDIRINIQEPGREIYLSPMLLSPFVENAFKHGISLIKPSWIYITLALDTKKLYFKVHNSYHARQEANPEVKSGVGLDNVKKRLELIYPDKYNLDIQQSEQDYFVSLILEYC